VPLESDTAIIGMIAGVEVIRATDDTFDSFDAPTLVFFGPSGSSAQFDDVNVRVP
jgi:hypothetical protein